MSQRVFKGALLLCSLSLSACLDATQVSFNVTTDIPCARLGGTAITVGLEGQTEKAEPVTVVTTCLPNGTVGAIGTYSVKPKSQGKLVVASVKVAVAVGEGANPRTDCAPGSTAGNCITARRRISFVAHRSLKIPIEILLICQGVTCDENSTCNRAGRCVSSRVDTSACDDQGVCNTLEVATGEGLPCLDSTLLCSGETSWCTVSSSGQQACAVAPLSGGQSFQCRDARDCGGTLQCVRGSDGVLGRCVLMASTNDTVLCTLGQPKTPCVTGPLGCTVDAGLGLTSCAALDAGVTPLVDAGVDAGPVDAGRPPGLPCPRTADLYCSGGTPYCELSSDPPRCVADGGAQCWFSSDCAAGQACFAGLEGRFTNQCAVTETLSNNVRLCDPQLNGSDCPSGWLCDGVFYTASACRNPNAPDAGLIVDAGFDAGIDAGVIDAGCQNRVPFEGGSGTLADPYLICHPAQLNRVQANRLASYALTEDLNLQGATFKRIGPYARGNATPARRLNNITTFTTDQTGHGFQVGDLAYVNSATDTSFNVLAGRVVSVTPRSIAYENAGPDATTAIADMSMPFEGTINGNGHVISHFVLRGNATENLGFVSVLGGPGELRDLTFSDVTVINTNSVVRSFTGVVAGQSYGRLRNVTVNNSTVAAHGFGVGCLIGYLVYGTATDVQGNCTSVIATAPGFGQVGGAVGAMYYGTLTRASSTAEILAAGTNQNGGLVGWMMASTVSRSWASGNVSGGDQIGGLVGTVSDEGAGFGEVIDSYSLGDVSGGNYVGGVVGKVFRNNGQDGAVTRSYSFGTVTGTTLTGGCTGDQGTQTADCFYNSTRNPTNPAYPGVTGLTSSQMLDSATNFSAYSFANSPWLLSSTALPTLLP